MSLNPTPTCKACGAVAQPGAQYCRACGEALEASEAKTEILGTQASEMTTQRISQQHNNSTNREQPIKADETVVHNAARSASSESSTEPQPETDNQIPTGGANTVPMESVLAPSTGPIDPRVILNAMPILQYLARKKADEVGPIFENYHFIFILHFLTDLIGFMEAFRLMGMSWARAHFLVKPYLYPYKDRIATQVANEGADVNPLTPNTLETIIRNIITDSKTDNRKIIVVEDGGYIVPLVHRTFLNDIDCFQGAVEQTTKGINEDLKVAPLRFPLLSVASAQIKRERESPEIAKAVWDNIRRLLFHTPRDLRNPTVLIVGYGSIGIQLSNHLKRLDATVKVFDADENKRQAAREAGFIVADNIVDLVRGEHGLILIGATGTTSISRNEILALDHDSVLVSASSDQREIGRDELRYLSIDPNGTPLTDPIKGEKIGDIYRIAETSNEVTLLAEGYPINFWNTESMPLRVSQVAMVPLFLSTIALATQQEDIDTGKPNSDFVDRLIEREDVYSRL